MLLMSQEFDALNTIRLWDTLLAAEKQPDSVGEDASVVDGIEENDFDLWELITEVPRFCYINYVAVALTLNVREKIVLSNGDFAICMESLQGSSKSINNIFEMEKLLDDARRIFL